MNGVLFDLGHVIQDGIVRLQQKYPEYIKRLEFHSGSFIDKESFPNIHNKDCLTIRAVLHDWPDKDVIRILKNIKFSLRRNRLQSKLYIIERVLKEHFDEFTTYSSDLNMGLLFQAKERTETEWASLLFSAGFKINNIFRTRTAFSIIVAESVDTD